MYKTALALILASSMAHAQPLPAGKPAGVKTAQLGEVTYMLVIPSIGAALFGWIMFRDHGGAATTGTAP